MSFEWEEKKKKQKEMQITVAYNSCIELVN